MTNKNLMITLDDGLIMTCLFPLFSALYMDFSASLSTLTLTMLTLPDEGNSCKGNMAERVAYETSIQHNHWCKEEQHK